MSDSSCYLALALVMYLIRVCLYNFLYRILSSLLHSSTLCFKQFYSISFLSLPCLTVRPYFTRRNVVRVQGAPSFFLKVMVVYGMFFHPSHG